MATTFAGFLSAAVTIPSGEVFNATTNAGGPTNVTVTAGTYASVWAFLTQLAFDLNVQRPVTGGTWTVTVSTAAGGTGKVTIAVTNGTYSLAWSSGTMALLLGFPNNDINGVVTSTATSHMAGLWLPDCPLMIDGNYLSAPRSTDLRQTESPTGFVIGHIGNVKYRHKNLRYSHVPAAKTWIANEAVTGESLEQFCIDVFWGQGLISWFSVSSKVLIVAHTGSWVGNGSTVGWYLSGGIANMDDFVKRATDGWDGLWSVQWPTIVSDG